jgi:hypothetical protein
LRVTTRTPLPVRPDRELVLVRRPRPSSSMLCPSTSRTKDDDEEEDEETMLQSGLRAKPAL